MGPDRVHADGAALPPPPPRPRHPPPDSSIDAPSGEHPRVLASANHFGTSSGHERRSAGSDGGSDGRDGGGSQPWRPPRPSYSANFAGGGTPRRASWADVEEEESAAAAEAARQRTSAWRRESAWHPLGDARTSGSCSQDPSQRALEAMAQSPSQPTPPLPPQPVRMLLRRPAAGGGSSHGAMGASQAGPHYVCAGAVMLTRDSEGAKGVGGGGTVSAPGASAGVSVSSSSPSGKGDPSPSVSEPTPASKATAIPGKPGDDTAEEIARLRAENAALKERVSAATSGAKAYIDMSPAEKEAATRRHEHESWARRAKQPSLRGAGAGAKGGKAKVASRLPERPQAASGVRGPSGQSQPASIMGEVITPRGAEQRRQKQKQLQQQQQQQQQQHSSDSAAAAAAAAAATAAAGRQVLHR